MKHLEIERLRAYAVLLTILTHIGSGRLPWSLHQGWAGVDLFFVISGFVITLSLLRSLPDTPVGLGFLERVEASKTELKQFFLRRAWRILPLALTVIAATLVASLTFNTQDNFGSTLAVAKEAVAILTGVYNYMVGHFPDRVLTPYWSLLVEEHFYLVMPFALIAARTNKRRLLVALGVVALVVFIVRPLSYMGLKAPYEWFEMRAMTHQRIDAMAVGVILALLRARGWGASLAVKSGALKLVCYGALVGIWLLPGILPKNALLPHAFLVSLWMMGGTLVFLASLDAGHVLALPVADKVLEYLGSRSYALYLTHLFAIAAAHEAIHRTELVLPGAVKALIGFGAVFGIAELAYRFVEKPGLEAGKRAAARLAVTPATCAGSRASRG